MRQRGEGEREREGESCEGEGERAVEGNWKVLEKTAIISDSRPLRTVRMAAQRHPSCKRGGKVKRKEGEGGARELWEREGEREGERLKEPWKNCNLRRSASPLKRKNGRAEASKL